MKKKLFRYNLLIVCTGLLIFFIASIYITYNNNYNLAENNVISFTNIFAEYYSKNNIVNKIDNASDNFRITIISENGTVISESKPLNENLLENHLDRPEIISASKGNPCISVRESSTLGVKMIYYAKKVDDVYIRGAVPVEHLNSYLNSSIPFLIFIFIITMLLSLLLSKNISNKLLRPYDLIKNTLQKLNDGEYTKIPLVSYEEVNLITSEIDTIAKKLDDNIVSLTEEKNKLNFLLNSVGDLIFAVNTNEEIVLLNNRTKEVFEVTEEITNHNLSALTINKILSENINRCLLEKTNCTFEISLKSHIYLATLKNVSRHWINKSGSLCVVVLTDITDAKNAQKNREEFFANASHELKTPLTAIKGFNELASINNKDENLEKYLHAIKRETDRMLVLIFDMLKLSELENTTQINKEKVDLLKVVEDVKASLTPLMIERKIHLEIEGKGFVNAEYKHIYDILKNLIENSIKYNDENGKVIVRLKDNEFVVLDNGFGISTNDHRRIFERFYRVEKSRNKASGGTGFGLSIVKHICSLYNAQIYLSSKLSKGTQITIKFTENNNY